MGFSLIGPLDLVQSIIITLKIASINKITKTLRPDYYVINMLNWFMIILLYLRDRLQSVCLLKKFGVGVHFIDQFKDKPR